jgi:uncharacterized protein YciI
MKARSWKLNMRNSFRVVVLCLSFATAFANAAENLVYDPKLAERLGADERGMRSYVFVVLKTGPKQMPAGPKRDEMFKGHFANMERLAGEGKLAFAGPFDGVDGWRGMFIFALVATDPVVSNGEMVPEFHTLYGSAALMLVNEASKKLVKR